MKLLSRGGMGLLRQPPAWIAPRRNAKDDRGKLEGERTPRHPPDEREMTLLRENEQEHGHHQRE